MYESIILDVNTPRFQKEKHKHAEYIIEQFFLAYICQNVVNVNNLHCGFLTKKNSLIIPCIFRDLVE